MFALLRATSVTAVLGLSLSLPTTADAQWFGWGWGGWGWDEPAYTTYYPGSYGGWYGYGAAYAPAGYGGYYAPGGCGCAPSCGCDPCGCNPCGCNPCGSACGGGGCSGGNCQGGNCSYDAPANGAPLPDPNVDAPPVRSRPTPSRTTPGAADDAPLFESPMRNNDAPIERTPPRSRSTQPEEQPERFQPRTRSTDPGTGTDDPFGPANPNTPRGTGNFRDNSTAPAGGTNRTRPGTNNDDLLDPALDKTFGTQKPPLPDDTGTVIQPRGPARGTEVKDGTDADLQGPRLDLKSTSAPVVLKTRLAAQQRASSLSQTAAKPVVRDWSAAMTEPRRLR